MSERSEVNLTLELGRYYLTALETILASTVNLEDATELRPDMISGSASRFRGKSREEVTALLCMTIGQSNNKQHGTASK